MHRCPNGLVIMYVWTLLEISFTTLWAILRLEVYKLAVFVLKYNSFIQLRESFLLGDDDVSVERIRRRLRAVGGSELM